jgi:general secretion pathway protein L
MIMAEWLILRLPRAADVTTGNGTAGWLVVDGDGRPLKPLQSGPLAAAAADAAGRRLAVLAPSADVLLADVELPQGAAGRAAQLAPFALEEQLVGNVEDQHVAIGRVHDGNRVHVAVVARSQLEGWKAQLDAAGLDPACIVAEQSLLPSIPGQAVATLEGSQLCLRDAAGTGHCIEATAGSLAGALELLLGESRAATALMIYTTPADWQERKAEIEALRGQFADLKAQLLNQGLLPWLAAYVPAAVAANQAINLLQGQYAPRAVRGAAWQRWRLAASLAAGLLVLHLGVQGWRLHQLGAAEAALDAQLDSLAGGVPPGSGSLRKRVEQALLADQSSDEHAGLLPAMQAVAEALRAVPGARVQSFDYRDNALQLKLRASDAQALERVNQALRQAGWQSQLVSGAAVGNAYEGSLRVLRGAS